MHTSRGVNALALLVCFVLMTVATTVFAQGEDKRINVTPHFGGDVLYCIDANGNATNNYASTLSGFRLLNISGNELWFVPFADVTAAIDEAQATGNGALIASGTGTYGPVWLYTLATTGNARFVFTGYDEYGKVNSMEFSLCQQVGLPGSNDVQDNSVECPADTTPDGLGYEVGNSGCFCPEPEETLYQGECAFAVLSDVAVKQDFLSVDPQAVLERVADLPISEWSYIDEAGVRHIGPMAQDFQAAFGLGSDDTMINMVDANGVVMAATQGLYARVTEQQAQIEALEQRSTQMLGAALAAGLLAGAAGAAVVFKRRG